MVQNPQDTEYRKVQGIVGQQSFSIILPKAYAINLGIGKRGLCESPSGGRLHHYSKSKVNTDGKNRECKQYK